ncbi:nitroreductase [Mycolicibacterium elephantis]|uniref:nitroreductase family protein n=1 Tax=Mycolicibacterium elephantis TaxID=81858 RepID=UPI0006294905|nr:nitroreductase family protein [Mycolicibacterium elephantis]KKW66111.1 nitroreductase [Mycolicibacterium elephantis]
MTDDLWTVMRTASAVRRYRGEPVDDAVIEKCLHAATWAPSGGNQQPWRFVVVRSAEVRAVISAAARQTWQAMTDFYGFDAPPADATDAKARVLRAMYEHMHVGGDAPVCVLFCVEPQPGASDLQQGGSIFPAVQNFLLAARAQGLGAAITLWQDACDSELRELVGIPPHWRIATLITAGWPVGQHHPVRRKPVAEVAAIDSWANPWRTS